MSASDNSDPFMGDIRLFEGTDEHRGWILCSGQTLQISNNTAMFSLIGTMYGGDGVVNFRIPNFNENASPDLQFYIALSGIYPSRSLAPYVGDIRLFNDMDAPNGWALCDGSMLPISQYPDLYACIGTTYGGDDNENFALPNFNGGSWDNKHIIALTGSPRQPGIRLSF
ncbi:tail fiber protein [Candidatus Chlorohelix allophototropha]|uniref:Tail fiber protein n=2 Tax=Candidatus Chlorohelix allophototropha TaxID=3003348 RepID=A0ABY9B9C3_9CHLR|nr:tail fiber protein [Chloroflexota bacterium L227-S17]